MSYAEINLVLKHSRTKSTARAVMLVIAHRINHDGVCWPNMARLAQDAGISERSAIRAVRELVNLGEIRIAQGGRSKDAQGNWHNRTNRYIFTLKPSRGGDKSAQRGVTLCPIGGDTVSGEYKENIKRELGCQPVTPAFDPYMPVMKGEMYWDPNDQKWLHKNSVNPAPVTVQQLADGGYDVSTLNSKAISDWRAWQEFNQIKNRH